MLVLLEHVDQKEQQHTIYIQNYKDKQIFFILTCGSTVNKLVYKRMSTITKNIFNFFSRNI